MKSKKGTALAIKQQEGSGGSNFASILSQRPLIGDEDPSQYDELRESFEVSFQPKDAIEWTLLKDIVDISWEILRLRRGRQACEEKGIARLIEGKIDNLVEEGFRTYQFPYRYNPEPLEDFFDEDDLQDPDFDLEDYRAEDEASELKKAFSIKDKDAQAEVKSMLEKSGQTLDEILGDAHSGRLGHHQLNALDSKIFKLIERRGRVLDDLRKHGAFRVWRLQQEIDTLDVVTDDQEAPCKGEELTS